MYNEHQKENEPERNEEYSKSTVPLSVLPFFSTIQIKCANTRELKCFKKINLVIE